MAIPSPDHCSIHGLQEGFSVFFLLSPDVGRGGGFSKSYDLELPCGQNRSATKLRKIHKSANKCVWQAQERSMLKTGPKGRIRDRPHE